MSTFKKGFLLLVRSKIFVFVTVSFPFLLGLWYLGVSRSYIELLSIIPTYISLTVPLFGGLLCFYKNDYLIKSKLEKVLLYKSLVVLFFYTFLFLLSLPILFSVSQNTSIDFGIVVAIYISLLPFTLFSIVLVQLIFTVFKGKIISYIISISILLLLTSGRVFSKSFFNTFFEFVKITPKLGRMYSGVVNIKDVIYFIALPLLIFLLGYFKEHKNKTKILLSVSFIIILTLGFLPFRLDLTYRGSNSVNKITSNTIKNGRVPINMTYYTSAGFKDIEEYLALFKGTDNINYRVITPKDKTFGTAVSSFDPIVIDDTGLYSFIVIEYLTRYRVIPLVSIIETLEFNLLKEIDFLISGRVESIGILVADDQYTKEDFSILSEVLEKDFIVDFLKPGELIPKHLKCLLVIGHKDIDTGYLAQIGDFLSKGGSILVAANGVDLNNNLKELDTPLLWGLKESGIIVDPYLVGDNDNVGIIDEEGRETPYPLNVVTKPGLGLKNDPFLNPFPGFNAIYLSPVRSNNPDSMDLLISSNDAWLVNSKTGLTSNKYGLYSGALYVETDLWKTFGGAETDKKNRVIVLGNTRSLTNLSYSLGISRGYDFVYRSIYHLLGKTNYLKVRHKFDYHDNSNTVGHSSFFTFFYIVIYPLLIFSIVLFLRRRFR